ncbi:MAG: hypothetical protein E6I81_13195 [Chloroflexi bacterium]|nr:MAG: hypothetical protein AUI15_00935 [Actinobacteria bacterium 13_2_20CM_2_66_6]TMD41069.1 MAG: hypothetical protein E6I89_02030 [Chloroflexota bacterium]TMD70751.1 MAG: hypothetical protein E6I81_13195 [Chloroflexota bacterium]
MVEAAAAFVAWLGASVVVLSDGRRGLALGVALGAAGIAVIALDVAGPIAAGSIALGGLVAAAGRLGSGREGWHIMPAGSTPRLVLCIAAGLLALWVAAGVATGPGAPLRFTAMVVIGLSGARVLGGEDAPVLFTATGLLALSVALAAGTGLNAPEPWPFLAAAILAGSIAWISPRPVRAA